MNKETKLEEHVHVLVTNDYVVTITVVGPCQLEDH